MQIEIFTYEVLKSIQKKCKMRQEGEIMQEKLYKLLLNQYGEKIADEIKQEQEKVKKVTLRVNNLKSNVEEIKQQLLTNNIQFKEVTWYKDALIIDDVREQQIRKLSIYQEGKIYLQSLSSMIPPLILDPKEGENILDMAAAPGGKTTQIAAMTNNKAWITACEKNKIRGERLKYNLEKQGVRSVNIMFQDARSLSDFFSFDKILLDSPCSGSGTESINNIEDVENLVERLSKIQEQLLTKALKLLKSNHEMVYSTCSILSRENEEIIEKVLKKQKAEIIEIPKIEGIETLPTKIKGTLCVKPTEYFEGFFVAKLKKI